MLVHIHLCSYQKQTILPGVLGVVEVVWDFEMQTIGLLSIGPLHLPLTERDLECGCCSFAYVLERNRRIISTHVSRESPYCTVYLFAKQSNLQNGQALHNRGIYKESILYFHSLICSTCMQVNKAKMGCYIIQVSDCVYKFGYSNLCLYDCAFLLGQYRVMQIAGSKYRD